MSCFSSIHNSDLTLGFGNKMSLGPIAWSLLGEFDMNMNFTLGVYFCSFCLVVMLDVGLMLDISY